MKMSKEKNKKQENTENQVIIKDIEELKRELQKLNGDKAAAEKNLSDVKSQLDVAKKSLTDVKDELDKTKKELDETKKSKASTEAEIREKKNELNQKEKNLNEKEIELEKKSADLEKREDNAKQGFTKQLNEAKGNYEKEKEKLKSEKEKIEKELSELGDRKDKKIAQIEKEVFDYREKRTSSVDTEIEKRRENSEKEALKFAQEAKLTAEEIIKKAEKTADSILKEASKEAEKQKDKVEQEKIETEKAREEYETQRKIALKEKADFESKKKEYENLKEYLEEKERNFDSKVENKVNEKYVDLFNKYEAIRENCNDLSKTNKELNEEKSKLQLQLAKAKSTTDDKKDLEITSLKNEIKDLEKKIKTKDAKIAEYGCEPEDVEVYKTKSNELDETLKKNTKLKKENEKLKIDLATRNDETEQLNLYKDKDERNKDTIRILEEELDKKKVVPREVRIAPIKEQLPSFNKNKKLDIFKLSEKDWLENILKRAEESGLKFSKRLLKAYHTSLKIGEWSPLVVLAGVSGTGKSELPRQYALHGGMNFISVPVKPDWDSPQSLFGYYNSIESKFEPTELLRALYQMQDNGEKNSKGEEMCLVLLDEMNLAHVELYFADLLSKFEGKRGTNEAAEYEISLGAGVGNEMLKIGDNVLWTGTMNEDETTKALSDKVVDRSTLVTFPRPKHLIGRQKAKIVDPKGILTKKKWEEWVKQSIDLDRYKGLMDNLRSIVEQINDKMSELGRNLGHRVWQGIQNYVSNHPDVIEADKNNSSDVDNVIKKVFAEAVAFKIMPKLRGIETSGDYEEYVDAIEKIINENVDELSKDFSKARSLPTRVFQWCSAEFLDDKE